MQNCDLPAVHDYLLGRKSVRVDPISTHNESRLLSLGNTKSWTSVIHSATNSVWFSVDEFDLDLPRRTTIKGVFFV